MIEKLLSPEVQKFIKDHQFDDPFQLSLEAKKHPSDFPAKEAIQQIQSRQKAKSKLPGWLQTKGIIFPAPISIEQCSSELTARYKSTLISGKSILDLTGGSGVDMSYFAAQFNSTTYVEPNLQLCELAQHNFKTLGINNVTIKNTLANNFLDENAGRFDLVFLDPSRRVENRKVFKIEDCSPNLYEIIPRCLHVAYSVLVKLSPLVDLTLLQKEFSPNHIWIVGVKNEVKEILCLIQSVTKECRIEAVMLKAESDPQEFKFVQKQENEAISEFSLPLKYIYEPNASIMKAGAFKLIGKHYGFKKLHPNTHLYTSEELIENFPGKTLTFQGTIKPNKKEIQKQFPNKTVNVLTRNYPISANQIKSKFGLKDGGEAFLIGVTLMDTKSTLLKCRQTVIKQQR